MAHTPHSFDWDDLKHLLAVARHGSTLAAGRALGVDQSTVQRRLVELERRIGQALVQRQPSGYRLTGFGQALLPHEGKVMACARRLGCRCAPRQRIWRRTSETAARPASSKA